MDEPRNRSVHFTERVERQENLGRFWLTVYNLGANGGSRNIIAFSYAGCCLYQMEMHLYGVWYQIYSIWIWLHLTVQLRSSAVDWQERMAAYVMWARICMSVSVHACLCMCVCISSFSVSVLWWETMVLSAACCCWQAPTRSAMRKTAASRACRGVSHVPVASLLSFASSPPCAQSHRYSTPDINPLSSPHCPTFKWVPLTAITILSTSVIFCFHWERKIRVSCKLVSAQICYSGASDL